MLTINGACWCLLDGETLYLMKNVGVCWRMLVFNEASWCLLENVGV